jgi:acyl-CoA dehydrogenase
MATEPSTIRSLRAMPKLNVRPVETLDSHINEIRLKTAEIINRDILPNEAKLWAFRRNSEDSATFEQDKKDSRALRQEVQAKVKRAGLWAPHLPKEYGGMGLGFLPHAYMNEVLAYSMGAASLFGVVAPNSGNQKILVQYGTPEQKKKWLEPLVEGTMQSGFSMTEPDSPGSDPRSLKTTARREGDEWVINGHKWFTSNGKDADFYIVMCRTDQGEGGTSHMTQFIVPTKTPGVNIVRGVPIWGRSTSDHCEIIYDNVRIPDENRLGRTGSGHAAAQDRLGAGRIYHCMNSVGQMWRAFDLMVHRAATREVHGGTLETKQFIQGFIADSYIDIQAARLMTIHAAERIDAGGDARTEISAVKIFVPAAYHRVVDRAIQVWGAAGVSGDLPLAGMYQGARTLRLADGPDEVHKILIAKNVFKRYHDGEGWDFGN